MAGRLRLGIESLQRGDPLAAVPHLVAVVDDRALRDADDLTDVLARATSLLAQALLEAGDLDAAELRVQDAFTILGAMADTDGLQEVSELRDRIAAERVNRVDTLRRQQSMERLADTTVADLRRMYGKDAQSLCEILLKKCNAEFEAGRAEQAFELAHEVLTQAVAEDWMRQEVLARLTLARIQPVEAETLLNEAWRRADRGNDHTLISTIARAAALAGVGLPTLTGPQMPADQD